MRSIVLTLCLGLTTTAAFSQATKKPGTTNKTPTVTATKKPPAAKPAATTSARSKPAVKKQGAAVDDKTAFEKASNLTDVNSKIDALKKFIAAFPNSSLLPQAAELLSATAYASGEEHLTANDDATAITLYKLAVDAAPKPVPERLFNESLSKIATTLYWHGDRADALDVAKALEAKVADSADQLAAMAMFHATIEDGEGAVRVAEAATKTGPTSAKAFQTLGLAYRVNFQLDDAAKAYSKALELDSVSTANKRSLAEIKRALGKSDEAVVLYRDLVTNDAADAVARSGLVLSLFDAGKKDEAEAELFKALEQNPRDVMLMGGAAYWYAANKNADKAVDLAQRAIAIEPRYVWSYIALGRGLMLQNKPLEAEEVLLRAKQYGNFPTLEYELASARCMAGFYRDAVEGLQKDFSLAGDAVTTQIGRRVERKDESFASVLADERRASILEPTAADDPDVAAKLRSLLALNAALTGDKPDEAAAVKAADAFVSGDDKYKLHRELYAASVFLDKKIAVQKAYEYANAAVGGADAALDVPNPGAAVMASELYDSRQAALARNELIQMPTVPRQMLSAILRGRVEEVVGWALLQQDKAAEADIHFRRAISIYPDTSAWWRSAMWRLGSALQAQGKDQEALDAFIKSYSIDKPTLAHYTVVEALYKKVNGSTEGLEAKVGRSPIADIQTQEVAKNVEPAVQTNPALPAATPGPTPTPEPTAAATPSATVVATPAALPAVTEPTPSASPSLRAAPTPVSTPSPEATTTPSPSPEATPVPRPSPEVAPTPTPSPVAEVTPAPTATPTPEVTSTPIPQPSETPTVAKAEPSREATSAPVEVKPTPEPTVEAKPEPTPTVTPETAPSATPQPSPIETKPESAVQTPAKADDQPKVEATPSPVPTETPEATATPNETSVAKVVISPGPTPTTFSALIGERARISDKPPSSSPAETKPKTLFDSVVITVPKSDKSAATTTTTNTTDGRSRIVEGQPVNAVDVPQCTLRVSQDRVSLLNGGGIASVLVGVDEAGDLKAVRAVSSSPDDVGVEVDRNMNAVQGRRLYLIRSLSEKTGMFQVTFQLPCGRKEISVTVR